MDNKDIVKLAVDYHRGRVQNYSKSDANDVLVKALVDLNGGNTVMDYRAIRDGKCNGVFALVEEILDNTIYEGLTNDMFFNNFVETRNLALGDRQKFLVRDNESLFYVSEIAEGTQGIRRQRLAGLREVEIPTKLYAVKIYEEMNRVLAGRVDFNEMIDLVSKSVEQQILNDVYGAFMSLTAADLGGTTYFPTAGAYDEDALLELIEHVEAAAGGYTKATIMGTPKALRQLTPSIQSDSSKEDLYGIGYYGKFYGNPTIALPQRHKVGSTDFVLDDKMILVVAGGDKPVKLVYEGDPLILTGDPQMRGDLTYEYTYMSRWGTGIILASNTGIGRYEMA